MSDARILKGHVCVGCVHGALRHAAYAPPWRCAIDGDPLEGATLLFLPPYSPDFSPIENAFTKLKALMRAKVGRTITALWDTIGSLVELFSPAQSANYLKAAGYEPD